MRRKTYIVYGARPSRMDVASPHYRDSVHSVKSMRLTIEYPNQGAGEMLEFDLWVALQLKPLSGRWITGLKAGAPV